MNQSNYAQERAEAQEARERMLAQEVQRVIEEYQSFDYYVEA